MLSCQFRWSLGSMGGSLYVAILFSRSLAQSRKVCSVSAVSLIFPPLVWSAFDSVYPSTAVLSAFLRQNGIATTQDDLNDEFANFLIDGPLLSKLGAGKVAHLNSS